MKGLDLKDFIFSIAIKAGNAYIAPNVSVDGVPLKPVTEFCYLGSMLANDALIGKEVENRISRASTSFGRLYSRV